MPVNSILSTSSSASENFVVKRREQEGLLQPRCESRRKTLRESILRIGDIEGHHGNRPYNILMDMIIFLVTTMEIGIVLFLSYEHYTHQQGLMALAMLLPIALNFVGVIYFLSDPGERRELEKSSVCRCATDFLQFPILGPVFLALKVLAISCGISKHNNYERIEASAVKMRQSSGFFTAAPEAMVQLTILLVTMHSDFAHIKLEEYMEMFAVILFTTTLAESNCYNPLSDYYKMFVPYKKDEWRLGEVQLWKKVLLFLHAFFSIGSRIVASAMLNAAVIYCAKSTKDQKSTVMSPSSGNSTSDSDTDESMVSSGNIPLILVVIVLVQMTYRLVIHYMSHLIFYIVREDEVPSGCYKSINYAWHSILLSYAFQSENLFSQIFFYVENFIFFGIWALSIQLYADSVIVDTLKIPMTILELSFCLLSIILLLACVKLRLINVNHPCHTRWNSESSRRS